ncbi:MAG TPA: amidohydrolase family protein [Ideonella sp.]|nr:amidohydrolase family protein [Ideonella sp.]
MKHAAVFFASFACALAHGADHYTLADYDRVEKIDAHMHLHSADPGFLQAAARERFKVLTINVDYPDFPPIVVQQRVALALALKVATPGRLAFAATFPVDRSNEPGWAAETVRRIDEAMQAGAVGIKVWKNIGMALRAADGTLVMIDDPRFAPVFDHLAERGIPLLGHQGEPYNCWLPVAEMTVNNDKEYFKAHPQYHMNKHPEMPGWQAQMAARDRMLAAHPGLRFVGMHLASQERDVDELAAFLDRFPGAVVDVAARIGQLQYQSQRDREKVRGFFIRYQDRLIYGSDLSQAPDQTAASAAAEARTVWRAHWRYFNTDQTMQVPELDRPVRGLALPRAVVDKLYRLNAQRSFPGAWAEADEGKRTP